ncbi:MAG TPA: hypothetical protein VEU47_02755 [Candidatus Cybelea sp.]|nr:hypothetical protein [Candidatus Cybelea sp.]
MDAVLGSSIGVFVGVTVVLFGMAAHFTGQSLATGWRPAWHVLPAALLLALADRFIVFALFQAPLLSLSGFLIHGIVPLAVTATSYRMTLAQKMVRQYPWLYERAGPFAWRARNDA